VVVAVVVLVLLLLLLLVVVVVVVVVNIWFLNRRVPFPFLICYTAEVPIFQAQ
jgi:hypothetical protein